MRWLDEDNEVLASGDAHDDSHRPLLLSSIIEHLMDLLVLIETLDTVRIVSFASVEGFSRGEESKSVHAVHARSPLSSKRQFTRRA